MEKTAQSTTGAPRRRRRRRGSGSGTPAAQGIQNAPAKEAAKTAQAPAQAKAPRQAPARKENKEQPAPAGRNRHRAPQGEPVPAQNGSHRGRGGSSAPAKEAAHPAKAAQQRATRPPRRAAEENPGLELITRRPPKQKFANFEEYLNAHGGMTVPLPEEETPAATPAAPAE